MSNQPTSRLETEQLHRATMRASVEAAGLDRRLHDERRQGDPGGLLQHWVDASSALRSALFKVRSELERHGTPRERLDRIGQGLEELQRRARGLDAAADLDACAESWDDLAREIALLSGPHRDALMRLVASRKAQIDRATDGLAQARKSGKDPERDRRLREVQDQRDRAWERYQRLRAEDLQAGGRVAAPGANLAPRAAKTFAPRAPGALEHRADRFAVRLASTPLDRLVERDRTSRDGVAERLEKTLASLATASRRTLTDPRAGELRGQLARMDGILSRLQGQSEARELLAGAGEIGGVLGEMGDLASADGDAPHLPSFRKLLQERRPALARLAGEATRAAGTEARTPLEQVVAGEGALPAPEKRTGLRQTVEHGLQKVDELRKKAGKQVEHGLVEVSKIAGTLGDFFGEASLLGRFAGRVHHHADDGHEKLHGALDVVRTGKKGLHDGRELLKEALELGAQKRPEKHHRAVPERRRQGSDLIDEVLRGVTEARIFADRSAHRGNPRDAEGQEIDPAAVDTWIGSGEGVKRFSEVFGAFLPAEGAQRQGRKRKEPGFFARLFRRVEEFAGGVAEAAQAGGSLLGKAMRYTGSGKRGLEVVEHAAEKVHDFAGKAEGFLHRMHLGRAAGMARQIGEAAAWVDVKSERAQEGLETADEVLGEARQVLGKVESFGHKAAKVVRRAHKRELTHVLQTGRMNRDVRAAEPGALHAEQRYGQSPTMQTLDLRRPEPDFKLADGEGLDLSQGIHTAKRTRSRGYEAGGKDELPDGEEFLDKLSGRVYELLMDELEQAFESR